METSAIEPQFVNVGGRQRIQPTHVVKLVAYINYTTVYLANGESFIIARTIGKVQETLQPHGEFIRISKNLVVNLAYMRQQTPNGIILKNNEIIDWSRRRKREVKKYLKKFIKTY
ncbi:LytTR family transcriptional regulator DNA-binding domain-containing protein [Emticicia sp. 17c]|uniref:LytTR family transcriptional regulator DNA-binding domain-containing protein n=1 Tax=Emticicia sp. 17c TaxID=3127704 RepID=UPI00301DECA7